MFGRSTKEFDEVRAIAEHDLALVANDILALDAAVAGADAAGLAVADYRAASAHFDAASDALERAHTVNDLRHVSSALDEARYALSCTRARLDGKTVPDRRAPCFFDPSHGGSLSDVDWTLPDGTRRRVPACGACAVAVIQGSTPVYREVDSGGQRVPHWAGADHHNPYSGGYYDRSGGLGGALLGGIAGLAAGSLIGDLLGGGGGGFGGGGGDFDGGDWG